MNKKIVITADSTCDFSAELTEKYKVAIVPLMIVLEGKQMRDGIDITADDVFSTYKAKKVLPKTAALSPAEYTGIFEKYVEQGFEVVHFSISSALSASHNNAKIGADGLRGVYVVDTKHLSTGSGLLIIKGAELTEKGYKAGEIYDAVTNMIEKVETSFVVDTLEFLHKGGRCSALAALGANLLKLKPGIEMKSDGTLGLGKKYRGALNLVLPQYVEAKLKGRNDLDLTRIFVTHSGCEPALVDLVKSEIQKHAPFEEILETRAGCTVSSHCGPNTLGILFMKK